MSAVRAERLSPHPIIYPALDPVIGTNINGPSLIRVPDWAGGLARYHLYFADHTGRDIRLAFADDLAGPWRIHAPGALNVAQTGFVHSATDLPAADASQADTRDFLYPHVASPDVHVDHEAQRILMYVHGLVAGGAQRTQLAVSTDGIRFRAHDPILTPCYHRAFRHGDHVYAIAWGGSLHRAAHWDGPFEDGPHLAPLPSSANGWRGIRHVGPYVAPGSNTLHVMFSRMGDTPERLLHATADMTGDWNDWRLSEPSELLRPETAAEGAELPLTTSEIGGLDGPAHQLRDPDVFVDADGSAYLTYAVAGESGIAIARLDGLQ